jgi:hypothetical protein
VPTVGPARLDETHPAAHVTLAALAIRDADIGLGQLWSLAHHYPVRHWFALGTAFELVDVAAIVAYRKRLPSTWTPDAWNFLGMAGLVAGVLVAALPEPAPS